MKLELTKDQAQILLRETRKSQKLWARELNKRIQEQTNNRLEHDTEADAQAEVDNRQAIIDQLQIHSKDLTLKK